MEKFGASLRESTYNATTVVQEYLALLNGLSRRIMDISVRVKDLRASLIVKKFPLKVSASENNNSHSPQARKNVATDEQETPGMLHT